MELSVLNWILLGFSVLSLALTLWQWVAGFQFPLHCREKSLKFAPSVSLLKPLKGTDPETKKCLRSWLEQEYAGPMQILFGVASPEDPVCGVVRELIAEFPKANAQLVICQEQFGPNAKVSTLVHLQDLATNELLVISDADVVAPRDFLANAVQPLADEKVGLVNSFYRFANPSTLPMQWEAVAVNADFWSQVLQSQTLKPIDFALGAAMVVRRSTLDEIGGFRSLVNFLADDYQLGNRIAQTGKQIILSPIVVECWEAPKNFVQIWNHQLRWARTIRVCQPAPFFFSILSNATLWPVLWTLSLALRFPYEIAFLPLLIFLPVRMFAALNLHEKLTGGFEHYRYFWMIPVRDLLGFVIWLLAFFGNTVEWRGERFRVQPGGHLVR